MQLNSELYVLSDKLVQEYIINLWNVRNKNGIMDHIIIINLCFISLSIDAIVYSYHSTRNADVYYYSDISGDVAAHRKMIRKVYKTV